MASFLTPDQFILRYDARVIRQRLSDTGTPVTDLTSNETLLSILGEATEMILSAALQGEEYSEADLQELADSTTAGFLVRRLTADLAMGLLTARRCTSADELNKMCPQWQFANAQLQQIRDGFYLFPRLDGEPNANAGLPRTADLTTQITSPQPGCSWSQIASSHLLPNSPTTNPFGCC